MGDLIFSLLLIIVILNIFFLFNSSIDWDSSSHLYYAKLKSKKIDFIASYRLGLKYFLPFFYSKTWPLIKDNLRLYRILNLFFFLATYFLLTKNLDFENNLFLICFIIICFNISFYNPQTSATEFISTFLIILLIDIHLVNELPIYFLLLIFLIISILFKINEIIYVIPFLLQSYLGNEFLKILVITLVIIIFLFFISFKNKIFSSIKNYFNTRTLIRPIKFFLKNWLIMSSIFIWSYYIFINGDLFIKLIFIILYLNYFAQKNLASYFNYPLIIFNLYFSLHLNLFDPTNNLFKLLILVFSINFLLTFVINLIYRDFEVSYRILNNFDFERLEEIKNEKKYLNFMQNISSQDDVVLWGHKILLMLKINNKQVFDQYYNSMHEKYYTQNESLNEKLSKFIELKKPKIIVDCDPGNMLGKIPSKIIAYYKKEFSAGQIRVFIRK